MSKTSPKSRRNASASSDLGKEQWQERARVVLAHEGNVSAAARTMGLNETALRRGLKGAVAAGYIKEADYSREASALEIAAGNKAGDTRHGIIAKLRRAPMRLEEVALALGVSRGAALDTLDTLTKEGVMLVETDGRYAIKDAAAVPGFMREKLPVYYSRPDGSYEFGVATDNHLGSKYARLDVLHDLYDKFEQRGMDRVFNCGNWIDGEARFNVHDLLVHGMEGQLNYLAKNYPQRKGLTTYAVSGDDHEGWYAQKFGVDIGRRAEETMQKNGRKDWVDLGYMESHVRLVHSETGAEQILAVVHPGGGSAYAISYAAQKWVEALDGGEKPAVALLGHWHKMEFSNIRNVWCIQAGTTEDQSPFMRKNKLSAHVGGVMVRLQQDAKSGAIMECGVNFVRYFNKGFTGGQRWNHHGEVVMPARLPNAQ